MEGNAIRAMHTVIFTAQQASGHMQKKSTQ